MVQLVSFVFGMFVIFLKALWLYFTEYIEWADAIALGFLAYLFAYHWQLPDKVSIGIGVAIGVAFLLLFHFSKIGWWISTGVFSLMWAYFAGELARSLFHVNDIVYWVVIAAFFGYFAWLHHYAKWRSWADEEIRKDEAAARRPKAYAHIETEEDKLRNERYRQSIKEMLEQHNRLVDEREQAQNGKV